MGHPAPGGVQGRLLRDVGALGICNEIHGSLQLQTQCLGKPPLSPPSSWGVHPQPQLMGVEMPPHIPPNVPVSSQASPAVTSPPWHHRENHRESIALPWAELQGELEVVGQRRPHGLRTCLGRERMS